MSTHDLLYLQKVQQYSIFRKGRPKEKVDKIRSSKRLWAHFLVIYMYEYEIWNLLQLYSTREKLSINIQKKTMLPHQSAFLREHRGNVYIKKINTNHLSPTTQLKTLNVWMKVSPIAYTYKKNYDHVLFCKLEEN